ncbi:MAG: sugar phosphate isomerase/epimerase [Candidatus Thermoplasmatota archaeon]|nr:sugar phosphate isomerase/epimerase [Candidatus Thermoplasmatota archaeon]
MIGIGSPTFCLHPFEEALEAISKNFQLWELLSEGEDRLDIIRGTLKHAIESTDMRFQVHAPLSDVNIGSVHEPMRRAAVAQITETISSCRDLGIPLVTVHPGFVQGIAFLDRARALEKTKESLKEIARSAQENAVEVVVENMPANINATCTTAKELVEAIEGTGFRICFDMGHANTSGQLDAMLALAERFGNVHLHNNEGQWDQHNVVNEGTADLEKVLSVLRRQYRGNMIIESTDLESGIRSKTVLERALG